MGEDKDECDLVCELCRVRVLVDGIMSRRADVPRQQCHGHLTTMSATVAEQELLTVMACLVGCDWFRLQILG